MFEPETETIQLVSKTCDARPVTLVPGRPRSGLGSHFKDVNVKLYSWEI